MDISSSENGIPWYERPDGRPPVFESKTLSERDQYYLWVSGTLVLEKVLDFYTNYKRNGGFPDAILLPESAARPLAYLIKAACEDIAKAKHAKVPQIFFFMTSRGTDIVQVPELELTQKLRDAQDVLQAMKEDTSGFWKYKDKERQMEKISVFEKELRSAKTEPIAAVRKQRGEEILKQLRQQGIMHPRLLVVDDFITPVAGTLKTIRAAFSGIKEVAGIGMLKLHTSQVIQGKNAWAGYIDPFSDVNDSEAVGFRYKLDPALKEAAIGVTREGELSKYVRPSPKAQPELMNDIRSGMGTIGHAIADVLLHPGPVLEQLKRQAKKFEELVEEEWEE